MINQQTLAAPCALHGHGVHSGEQSTVILRPAPVNTGIVFCQAQSMVKATADHIVPGNSWRTVLGTTGFQLSTPEHLLSAISGMGISNVYCELQGSEIPILDGSAMPWIQAMLSVGIQDQGVPAQWLRIQHRVFYQIGQSWISVEPCEWPSWYCEVDFPEPVGKQSITVIPDQHGVQYQKHIAPARTFGFQCWQQHMDEQGLALGTHLGNTMIIGDTMPHARVHHELAAHKLLDLLGDLSLCGYPIWAKITAHRPGHKINLMLAQELRNTLESHQITTVQDIFSS